MSTQPENQPERALQPEEIFAAWALRVEDGEPLEFEDLVREHPQSAEHLRRLHEDWEFFGPILGRAIPGLVADDTGMVMPSLSHGPDADEDEPSADLLARLGIHAPNEGRYRFRAVIGRGGGGVVLKVWDAKLNRPLAMKVVLGRGEDRPSGQTPKLDSQTLSRFVDEARIASQLNHPGIVPVHELGADETGRAFFTMKLVKGLDLSQVFEKVRTGEDGWNTTRAVTVLLRVCEAMAYAHDKGVIHRDLKPANIMVGPYGEVHVMDWGLARVLDEPDHHDLRLRPVPSGPISVVRTVRKGERDDASDSSLITIDGTVLGTPCYMSPEQARGEVEDVGPSADVYAVGAMLYHLLTGEPPYLPHAQRVPAGLVLTKLLDGPPPDVESLAPHAPVQLVAICQRAMARSRAARYPNMRKVADELRAFLESRVVEAYEVGPWAETKSWVRRNKALATIATTATVALITALGVSIYFRHDAEERRRESEASLYMTAISGAVSAIHAGDPHDSLRRALDSAPELHRSWEWQYINAASDESIFAIETQIGTIGDGDRQFAIQPQGEVLAAVAHDGSIAVWTAHSGQLVHMLVPPSGASAPSATAPNGCVAFTSDGRLLATISNHDGWAIWDVATGELAKRIDAPRPLSSANCCMFSPDGSQLTALVDDALITYDVMSGSLAWSRDSLTISGAPRPGGGPKYFEYNQRGSSLLVGSSGRGVYLMDAATGKTTHELHHSDVAVPFARFSPDGKHVVACSWHGSAFWDAESGEFITWLDTGAASVLCAAFSPDGTRVATVRSDGLLRVWDTATGKLTWQITSRSAPNWVSYSPDGALLITASGDGILRIWDTATHEHRMNLRGHRSGATFAQIDPKNEFVHGIDSTGQIRGWSMMARRDSWIVPAHVSTSNDEDGASGAHLNAQQQRIAVADREDIVVFDAVTQRQLIRLSGHAARVQSVAYSPDGKLLLSTSHDLTARLWDANLGVELLRFSDMDSGIKTAVFNDGGRRVRTASYEGVVCEWDAQSGARLRQLMPKTDSRLSLSSDGHYAASLGKVRLFDLDQGLQLGALGSDAEAHHVLAFSPDSTHLLTSSQHDARLISWNTERRSKEAILDARSQVSAGCYSPDGTRIATISRDKTLRIWNAHSGSELLKVDLEHNGTSVTFSDDGLKLLVTMYDHTVQVLSTATCSDRYKQIASLSGATHPGRATARDFLLHTGSFRAALEALLTSETLDTWERRAALNELSLKAESARTMLLQAHSAKEERAWLLRIADSRPIAGWDDPTHAVELPPHIRPFDAFKLNELAWSLVNPQAPQYGRELYALALSRMAVDDGRSYEWAYRNTLAHALFMVGDFEAALAEQARCISEAPPADKPSFERNRVLLQTQIASLCDDAGAIRSTAVKLRMLDLDRRVQALELDPDVLLWRSEFPQ